MTSGKKGLRNLRKTSSLSSYKLIGLDTNIFIYHFHNNPQFIEKTDFVFELLEEKRLRAVTSIITIAELLAFTGPEKILKNIKESFLSTPNLIVSEVNQQLALKAASIRRNYKFALPDSIQLATALDSKAQTFVTNDKRLKIFKELPITLLTELDK